MSLLVVSIHGFSQDKIKIGYVGNSITAANHNRYWFPLEFEAYSDNSSLLINQYFGTIADVQNFGDGGKTMVDKINPETGVPYDDSYMRKQSFADAMEFAPDILFISLGTNDGRVDFWPDTDGSRRSVLDFYDDYMSMIDSFKMKNPDTYFILGYPPPIYGPTDWNLWVEEMILNVRPEIDKVITDTGCDSIDWHRLLLDAGEFFPDNLHPDKAGCVLMGQYAFEKIISAGLLDSAMSRASLALDKPVSVTSESVGNIAEKAVDIDEQSYWETDFTSSQSLCVDLGIDYDIHFIQLAWRGKYKKNYQLQLSTDSINWTTIDSVAEDTLTKNLHLGLRGAGRYVKLLIEEMDSASFALNEFEVFGVLHIPGEDITELGGATSAQYSSPEEEGPENSIDNVVSTKFLCGHKEVWLQYDAPAFYRLNGYTITAGSDGGDRNPIKWIVQGSDDNRTWVPLDSVGYNEDVEFYLRFEKQYYLVSDTNEYDFFRIVLTSASSIVHIGEWELYGDSITNIPKYNVSLSTEPLNIDAELEVSGTYWQDHEMKISAKIVTDYKFTGWLGSEDDVALLKDPFSQTTTFLMPRRNVNLTASYKDVSDVVSSGTKNLRIYPNPAWDILFVSGADEDTVLKIYNLSGTELNSVTGSRISTVNLSSGVYIVHISSQIGTSYCLFTKV